MSSLVQQWVIRSLKLREEDAVRALLLSSYFLLIIACYITTKSVRDSLFLKHIGFEQLPYVYILIALVAGVFASLYTKVSSQISIRKRINTSSLIAIVCLFVFWWLLQFNWSWMFYALYVWVSLFGAIMASQGWLLAHYIFNPREAKRVFALIGAGGILGSILGGYLTQFGARWFGTEGLLLCCMVFVGSTLLILRRITKEEFDGEAEENLTRGKPAKVEPEPGTTWHVVGMIRSSRHLTMLTVILGITVIVESFIDFELKVLSDQAFETTDDLTAFFGVLFAYWGILSLFFQLFFTSRILQRFGVGISILFLPVALFWGSVILVLIPSLMAVTFLKISDGSFRYSIHKSGMELLYLPVPMKLKTQVKSFIDMVVDRSGRGIAGVILLFTSAWALSIQQLSMIVCGLLTLWLFLAISIKREYLNSFRAALEKKSIDPDLLSIGISDSASLEAVINVLNSSDERQVVYALELLKDTVNISVLNHLPPLLNHLSPRVRALALQLLASEPNLTLEARVKDLLIDSDLSVRTESVHFLCQGSESLVLDRIQGYLNSEDYAVLGAAIQCLAKYQRPAEALINERFVTNLMTVDGPQRQAARASAASALGLLTDFSPLQRYLTVLLQEPSTEVVRNAIQSAGRVRSREVLPLLIYRLADRRLRSDARKALVEYGTKITSMLYDYLNDYSVPMSVRANIPKLLSDIGSQEAADALMRSIDQTDQFLGYRVIKALNRIRMQHAGISFSKRSLDSLVVEEIRDYCRLGLMLQSERLRGKPKHDGFGLLHQALRERIDKKLERIFRLLGLRYSSQDMVSAYNGIRSRKSHVRAGAIEFLDNLLLTDLKQLLLPLLEDVEVDAFVQKATQLVGFQPKSQTLNLRDLIKGRDPWLKTIAIYLAGRLRIQELANNVKVCVHAEDPFVGQTALWSLERLSLS